MADTKRRSPWKPALATMSIGIEMGVAITVGYLVGNWLDSKLNTAPWLMYLFLVLGIAAAFRGLWRTAKKNWSGDDDGDSGKPI